MRILVTGAGGQLGRDLVDILGETHEVSGLDRDGLNITDLARCRSAARKFLPDAVVHAAAYTAVDQAESDEEEAYRVNVTGTANMTIAAREIGAKLCYISTDYVFSGNGEAPYKEYDETGPASVYGKTKLAGERSVQALSGRYFIVRTSWVYGRHGSNFVKTMLELAKSRPELKVVHDQTGSPTYTADLVRFIGSLVDSEQYGIYHASNTGACTWYDLARAVFEEAGLPTRVIPCRTEEFPRPAPRPAYSVLDHLAIRAGGFSELRPWRDALKEFLADWHSRASIE
ncbi:dTDP-4-dehydrorhamnose reductase [Paenibacillus aurantius]|uniref:dTDP-4-dehydrorhamnose reductase n=1 Tax=Paenibacillus aurantius TaxID=2918900 RepID=A0AA96REW3_9BACL|nr:dTDP-4-dehydrorhamnose reductase [Paenibacillus aurantius]WNQ12895.1 dTDP-4-dehydrorhamnose reductase [Paenibacillus aurantius]